MHVDDGPNQDPSKRTWDLYDDDGRPITTFEQLRASVLDTSDEAVKRLLTFPSRLPCRNRSKASFRAL
ncbi:MAG: hypothetical protein JOZ87_05320 [Chloroflexi bacterium]|nr:hypothetical protein [Chloroflexota bacterium]